MSTTITNLPETSKVNGSDYLVLDQPDKTVKSTVSNFLTDTGVVLATQLKDTDGADLIQSSNGNTVQEELNNNLLNDREQWCRSLAEAGLTLVDGSFEEGATLNNNTDAVWYIAGGQCYTWNGAFPKTVPADSTPTSTGGVDPDAWVSVGDTTLRETLASNNGASLVGTESGSTLQDVISNYADRIATCEKNSRYENFHTLLDTCTAELLSLNAPEAYDQSITLTINEELTTDYTGQITGSCNILNPQNYTLILCTSSTMEYQSDSLVLNADGTFLFSRSWPGAKSFRLTRTATGGLLTVWEDPLCIRSYRMPADAGSETVRVMKDRTYTYDQAVSAMALIAQNHSQVERFIRGLCAIVGSGGSEGSVPFFVNRMSAQTSSQYYRTGNAAWVAYALAYYLLKYPNGGMAADARDKLMQCVSWIEKFRVTDSGDIRSGLYISGSGRYLDGVFYPDFKADWCTSEHQFDLWFVFDLMGRVGFTGYAEKAKALADAIMEKLWVEDEGRFYAGMRTTGPDNASPLDCSSWGGLFVANIDMDKARRCFTYLERFWYATHEATGYTPYHPKHGYPNKQRGVWVEGSAGVALLARRLGMDDIARDILARLAPLRTRYGYIDSSDYPDNDDMPAWPSSCNTAWVILACDPQGFWNVNSDAFDSGYYRY